VLVTSSRIQSKEASGSRFLFVLVEFDLLFLNGKHLRKLPPIERKAALKKLLRRKRSRVLYLNYVEGDGRLLFEQIVRMDLEGIVSNRKNWQVFYSKNS
jgi:bifunctional non-homologous end joining protein LigD